MSGKSLKVDGLIGPWTTAAFDAVPRRDGPDRLTDMLARNLEFL